MFLVTLWSSCIHFILLLHRQGIICSSIIEQHLNNGDSFRSIAIELSKDPSTISKEIRRHSIIRERSADAFAPIPCANNYDSSKPRTNICNVMHMCGDNECRRKCVLCRKFRCSDVCKFSGVWFIPSLLVVLRVS